ncbi:hypothetical protein WH91_16040 [Devosia psychrophila]|uniref:Secreted protein n=1 Tax=Devosia psychrophila TaxID=728005 RepID=A0ABR5DVK8_9HYPH|nr:hypothetical protein WH91_16040 [Devosia psychrophila]
MICSAAFLRGLLGSTCRCLYDAQTATLLLNLVLLTKCGIHILAAAKARKAAKDFVVLSKRMVMRRSCLSLFNMRSKRLRPL